MAYLDPVVGREQRGRRPVVVISPSEIQDNLDRAIVVPFTTQKKDYPTYWSYKLKGKTSYAMLDQIRTLDLKRLQNKVTELSSVELARLLARVQELFAV